MGFLDKAKEQMAVATAAAKDAAQKGQAKFDEVTAKKGSDALLRDLGAAYYAQWTNRGTASTPNDIERLVAALGTFEEEHGPLDLTVAPEPAPAASRSACATARSARSCATSRN